MLDFANHQLSVIRSVLSDGVAKISNRGSRPGERRGGRTKGTPNKATADIKALAGKYTPEALKTLVSVMQTSESDAARVAAAKELLDRGHGKSPQPQTGADGKSPIEHVHTIRLVAL